MLRHIYKLILFVVLVWASSAWAAVAHVQEKYCLSYVSGTTMTCTFDSNTTSGNSLVGMVVWPTDTVNLSSVTGSTNCNVTYTLKNANTDGSGYSSALFYGYNVGTTGSCTITATFSAAPGGYSWMIQHEASGVKTSADPFDASAIQAQSAPGTGTDAVSSGSITASNGAYVAAFSANISFVGDNILSPGSGWTGEISADYAESERRTGSGGSVAGTFTASSGADAFHTGVLSLLESGGGSANAGMLLLLGVGK